MKNLLSISAAGENCVLSTKADDSTGQVMKIFSIFVHEHVTTWAFISRLTAGDNLHGSLANIICNILHCVIVFKKNKVN